MPINPTIAMGVQPMQMPDQMNALARFQQIQGAQQQGQLNQMKMEEYQRGVQQQNALRNTLAGFQPGMSVEDQVGVLTRGGHLTEARSLAESHAKASKDAREAQAAEIKLAQDRVKLTGQILGAAKDEDSYQRTLRQLKMLKIDTSEFPPAFDAVAVEGFKRQALDAEKQLEQHFINQDTGAGGQTLATSKYGSGPAVPVAGSQFTKTATPDATLRSEDARKARAQAQQHFDQNLNAPQYMATDAGIVALPKTAGKGPIVVQSVAGPTGEPLGKPLANIPPVASKAIITNAQNLTKAEKALKLIQDNPDATGLKGYAGDAILQRTDPEGVETRAAISDLGSMVLHDRSGAAITASEFPRLRPFIPTATDNGATIEKKLKRFIEVYQQEQEMLTETYSKAQGYKPSPVTAGEKSPAASLSPIDTQALEWANANPKDPRAAQIKQRLGK